MTLCAVFFVFPETHLIKSKTLPNKIVRKLNTCRLVSISIKSNSEYVIHTVCVVWSCSIKFYLINRIHLDTCYANYYKTNLRERSEINQQIASNYNLWLVETREMRTGLSNVCASKSTSRLIQYAKDTFHSRKPSCNIIFESLRNDHVVDSAVKC